ncbi:MAG: hypothetical protein CMJ29_10360 [Phycisphaerae bacterium]|nr:hypothetical protein [Phycisphaerae bacterium]|tara:strand:- start:396 stop:1184 length:789 start_codon:yes stop_codon:yes gene_type:complete
MNCRDLQVRCCPAVLITAMLLTGFGCASGKQVVEPEPPRSSAVPLIDGHGLAIRFHDTNESMERIHEVVDELPAERLTDDDWAEHGVEIIRIREQDLAELLERLPSVSEPGLNWHGQALTWRNLMPPAQPVGERIMVTGQTEETFPDGRVGLSGRGWSIMTLDGPRVQVELAPIVEIPGGTRGRFAHLRREFLVGPGDNLLLIAGSGIWPHPPPEDTSDEAEEAAGNRATMGQLFLEIETESDLSRRLLMITPRFRNWTDGP